MLLDYQVALAHYASELAKHFERALEQAWDEEGEDISLSKYPLSTYREAFRSIPCPTWQGKKWILLYLGKQLMSSNGILLKDAILYLYGKQSWLYLAEWRMLLPFSESMLLPFVSTLTIDETVNPATQEWILSPFFVSSKLEPHIATWLHYPQLPEIAVHTQDLFVHTLIQVAHYVIQIKQLCRLSQEASTIYQFPHFQSYIDALHAESLTSYAFVAQLRSPIDWTLLAYACHKIYYEYLQNTENLGDIFADLSFQASDAKSLREALHSEGFFAQSSLITLKSFMDMEVSETEEDSLSVYYSREALQTLLYAEHSPETLPKVPQPTPIQSSSGSDRRHNHALYQLKHPQVKLSQVILDKSLRADLQTAIELTQTAQQLEEWGVHSHLGSSVTQASRILLYGISGTGKSLTAEAIAGEAGADLFKVSASDLVTAWIGESAKNVRRVFQQYYEYQAKADKPIFLFFNEADQILSRRGNIAQTADKEYNQMQNLLLEEMENFSGVLIATTNLVDLFDSAWNRRFNMKIKFDMPRKETRLLLWQAHIPKQLPIAKDVDFHRLAEFDLTGGAIANIVYSVARKVALRPKDERFFRQEDFLHAIRQEMKHPIGGDKQRVGFP